MTLPEDPLRPIGCSPTTWTGKTCASSFLFFVQGNGAIRMRKFDDDAKILSGANLVPGIIEAQAPGFAA